MKYNLVLACLLIGLFSCSGERKKPTKSTVQKVEKPNGVKLYNRNCVVCHGDEGNAKIGGALDLSTSTLTDDEKFNIIKHGSENKHMRAFSDDLSDDEIKAVVTHINTLIK